MVGVDYNLLVPVSDSLRADDGEGKHLDASGDEFIKLMQQEGRDAGGNTLKPLAFLKWAASNGVTSARGGSLNRAAPGKLLGQHIPNDSNEIELKSSLGQGLYRPQVAKISKVDTSNDFRTLGVGIDQGNLVSEEVVGNSKAKQAIESYSKYRGSDSVIALKNMRSIFGNNKVHEGKSNEVLSKSIEGSELKDNMPKAVRSKSKNAMPEVVDSRLKNATFGADHSRLEGTMPKVVNSKFKNAIPEESHGRLENAIPEVSYSKPKVAMSESGYSKLKNAIPEVSQSRLENTMPKVAHGKLKNSVPKVAHGKLKNAMPEVVHNKLENFIPRVDLGELNKNNISSYSKVSGDSRGAIFVHPLISANMENQGNDNVSYSENMSSTFRMEGADGKVSDLESGFVHFTNKSDSNGSLSIIKLDSSAQLGPSGIIDKLSDYIIQSGIRNSKSLEVLVDHSELGYFKINANKVGVGNQIELSIETGNSNATDFFNDNELDLIKSLMRSGVKLSKVNIIPVSEGFISTIASNNGTSDILHSDGDSREDLNNEKDDRKNEGRESRDEKNRRMWQELNDGMESGDFHA